MWHVWAVPNVKETVAVALFPVLTPRLFSLTVQIVRRPGENYHMMYATVEVTQVSY